MRGKTDYGKGSTRRPGNLRIYGEHYDRIFRKLRGQQQRAESIPPPLEVTAENDTELEGK